MASGWIKIYRELIDKPIWIESTPEQKAILITLLCMANHERKGWIFRGEKYVLMPGQMITSLPKIAEKAGKGVSLQNVRTALKRFKLLGFLTDESTNKNRLITIANWAIYQNKQEEETGKSTGKLTGNQQAPNRHLTPNKKVKNVRSKEKDKKTSRRANKFDDMQMKLAQKLFNRIQEHDPNYKQPNMEKWANDIRLMMEQDKRSYNEIDKVIDWCQDDDFWYKNILSTAKLRKQFTRLRLQYIDEWKKKKQAEQAKIRSPNDFVSRKLAREREARERVLRRYQSNDAGTGNGTSGADRPDVSVSRK